MKKVFRTWKLVEVRFNLHKSTKQEIIDLLKEEWLYKLEGKTLQQIEKLGFMTCSDWMVEEE